MRHPRHSMIILALLGLLSFVFLPWPISTYSYGAELTPAARIYLPIVIRQPTPTPTATPTVRPTPTPTSTPTSTPPLSGWLAQVNSYRAMAGLPAVTENTSWSYGNWLHGRYMVKNDVIQHSEDPSNPWYTPAGSAAAQASNLTCSYGVDASDEYAVNSWMQAPFHAIGMLDPALLRVGYGSYREADGGLQMGAGLDVIRGLGSIPPSVEFPIRWPSDGTSVPLTRHWGEYPSPLTSCPGYSAPSGLPIILQIGPGNLVPNVTSHSFMRGSAPLDHCVFDETNYANPDSSQQSLGRSILDFRDAIVLVPRDPLTPGASYTVSITANGQAHTWSFTVSNTAETASAVEHELVPRWDGIVALDESR